MIDTVHSSERAVSVMLSLVGYLAQFLTISLELPCSLLMDLYNVSLETDYIVNFSLASETNPLKIKLVITWRMTLCGLKIQGGLKILYQFFKPWP